MQYEEYATYQAQRLARLRPQDARRKVDPARREELMRQLLEVVGAIEGQISSELVAELREELGRLA